MSVNTVVERSYNHQINVIIARHMPSLTEAVTRTFALSGASHLQSLFKDAGFADIETARTKQAEIADQFERWFARGLAVVGFEGTSYLLGVLP